MSPLDLSFRHKIPLWGSVLVIVTAMAVSATLMVQTYIELEEDLVIDSDTLARALTPNLFSALLQGDVWWAYETISTPQRERADDDLPNKAENLIVVDNSLRVFVASQPRVTRMRTLLKDAGPEYAVLATRMESGDEKFGDAFGLPGYPHLFVVRPISRDGQQLGSLIVVLTRTSFMPRFYKIARYGFVAGAVILCILLPFNWYWGQRMAAPLAQLAARMQDIGQHLAKELDPVPYSHRDELGSLFNTYNKMLADLKSKEELERQVVQSDRLAALGQLAAGVAHEINNPLGGMLMAIDTLKQQGVAEPRTAKTIALLERGLGQIKDTVGALLVEARVNSRNLTPNDIEDVLVLILPQVRRKTLHLEWQSDVAADVALPATLVRQVLINLLLNAVRAAAYQGQVACRIGLADGALQISVANDGKVLSNEQMGHLFEPFSPLSEDGHGLGLWVSYQIVHQLDGKITASRNGGRMQFEVWFPIEAGGPA
jgi:two-component system, NtrC family, sensor kinase